MKRIVNKRIRMLLVLMAANLAYFSLINPVSSKSWVIFGGFILLGLDLFLLFKLILRTVSQLAGKQSSAHNRTAALATVMVVTLLALQSIGQLSVRDAIAVLCVSIIFLFYSSYYRFGQRS